MYALPQCLLAVVKGLQSTSFEIKNAYRSVISIVQMYYRLY